jgi:hypothetical protein
VNTIVDLARVRLIIAVIALAFLTSCGWLYSPVPKSLTPAKSRRVTTARGEKWMLTSIDLDLAREKRGEHPTGGKRDWREYWKWRTSLWHKQKSGKQYAEYLARRRKELGLPDVRRL